jgi:hypothetical protein
MVIRKLMKMIIKMCRRRMDLFLNTVFIAQSDCEQQRQGRIKFAGKKRLLEKQMYQPNTSELNYKRI